MGSVPSARHEARRSRARHTGGRNAAEVLGVVAAGQAQEVGHRRLGVLPTRLPASRAPRVSTRGAALETAAVERGAAESGEKGCGGRWCVTRCAAR